MHTHNLCLQVSSVVSLIVCEFGIARENPTAVKTKAMRAAIAAEDSPLDGSISPATPNPM